MPGPRLAFCCNLLSLALLASCSESPDQGVEGPAEAEAASATAGMTARTPEERADVVRSLVAPLLEGRWVPGFAVALFDARSSEFHSFQLESAEGPQITEDTLFEIGSITKVFTGVALAGMSARGEVALDEPVGALLPEGTRMPGGGGERISLIHLATHRSGLPRLPGNFAPPDLENPYVDYRAPHLYEFLSTYTLPRPPGFAYEYSNLGFGLLGHALSLRAERSYADLITAEVTEPLGLANTAIELSDAQRQRLAAGHDADGEPRRAWDFDVLGPAGNVRSSAKDLLTFAQAAMAAPEGRLGTQLAASMQARTDYPEGQVGLAWHLEDGVTWHNGQTAGHYSFLAIDRERQVGVIVLSPSASPLVVDALARTLVQMMRGEPVVPLPLPKDAAIEPDALDDYVGTYAVAADFTIEVWREGDVLRGRGTGQPSLRLWPSAKDEFYLRMVPARIGFERDEAGAVTGLVLSQEGARTRAQRI